MADKRIIIVLCLILIVALGLVNLVAFQLNLGSKITGMGTSESGSYEQAQGSESSEKTGVDSFVNVGEPRYYSDSDYSSDNAESNIQSGGSGGSGDSNGGQEQTPATDECLQDYSLSEDTIIFYYSDDAHSDTMKVIVNELEPLYDFYWTNELWDNEFNSCFGTTGATPTFICTGNGEKLVGEVPKHILEDLSSEC